MVCWKFCQLTKSQRGRYDEDCSAELCTKSGGQNAEVRLSPWRKCIIITYKLTHALMKLPILACTLGSNITQKWERGSNQGRQFPALQKKLCPKCCTGYRTKPRVHAISQNCLLILAAVYLPLSPCSLPQVHFMLRFSPLNFFCIFLTLHGLWT